MPKEGAIHARSRRVRRAPALAVALGGTAYALATDSVRSRHIRDGQVKPRDLGIVKVVERPGPDSIPQFGSPSSVSQDFTVNVPEPGLARDLRPGRDPAGLKRRDLHGVGGPAGVHQVPSGKIEGELRLYRFLDTSCGFRNVELYLMPLS